MLLMIMLALGMVIPSSVTSKALKSPPPKAVLLRAQDVSQSAVPQDRGPCETCLAITIYLGTTSKNRVMNTEDCDYLADCLTEDCTGLAPVEGLTPFSCTLDPDVGRTDGRRSMSMAVCAMCNDTLRHQRRNCTAVAGKWLNGTQKGLVFTKAILGKLNYTCDATATPSSSCGGSSYPIGVYCKTPVTWTLT